MQQRTCQTAVEKLDHGSHQERGDHGSCSDKGEHSCKFTAAQQKQCQSQNHTDQVTDRSANSEGSDFPDVGGNQGDRVIGGDTQVSRKIQRRGDTHHHNAHGQKQHPEKQGQIRKQPQQKLMGIVGHITHHGQIDDGGQTDVMSVSHEDKGQKDCAEYHI